MWSLMAPPRARPANQTTASSATKHLEFSATKAGFGNDVTVCVTQRQNKLHIVHSLEPQTI